MIAGLFGSLIALLLVGVWLAVIIYLIGLASRLVKAVERIADKLEAPAPKESMGR
jgi:uncharacterized membrane protein